MNISKRLLVGFMVLMFPLLSSADKVEQIYVCNNDDVGIKLEDGGWVVVRKADTSEKRVDRIFSLAAMLLASQGNVGYYNAGSTVTWCGLSVKTITVFQAQR